MTDLTPRIVEGDKIKDPRSLWELRHNALCDFYLTNEQTAERYKFLRAGGPGTGLYVADAGAEWREVKGEQLDTAIDRAIEGEKK